MTSPAGALRQWDAWLAFFPIERSVFGLVEVHLRTLIMTGPFTAALVALLVFGIRFEGKALADQLRKEAAEGTGAILPQEAEVLAAPWQRLRQRMRALKSGGAGAYIRVARLQSAQLDLAVERWHRERQEIEAPLEAEHELRQHVIALRQNTATL